MKVVKVFDCGCYRNQEVKRNNSYDNRKNQELLRFEYLCKSGIEKLIISTIASNQGKPLIFH